MEKDDGVKQAPTEAMTTLILPLTPMLILAAPASAPEPREECYKKRVGEEATFLENAKDYFNQFKEMPAQKHWICLRNFISYKCDTMFGKQKVIKPVVKDEAPEVAKPAAGETH